VQDDVPQRVADADLAAVRDEAELAEFVHEKTDPRPGGADHLGQGFLADLGDHRLRLSLFAEIGQPQQKPRHEGAKISACHGVGGMFAASGTIIMSNEPP
jgi:hypothetical protein